MSPQQGENSDSSLGTARFVDHYATLGVDRYASRKEIKSAIRRQLKKVHPDRRPPESDTVTFDEQFAEIMLASQILLNPETRVDYDYDFMLECRSRKPMDGFALFEAAAKDMQEDIDHRKAS